LGFVVAAEEAAAGLGVLVAHGGDDDEATGAVALTSLSVKRY
jgi:hypothetical protein